jgi:hypothetical protein
MRVCVCVCVHAWLLRLFRKKKTEKGLVAMKGTTIVPQYDVSNRGMYRHRQERYSEALCRISTASGIGVRRLAERTSTSGYHLCVRFDADDDLCISNLNDHRSRIPNRNRNTGKSIQLTTPKSSSKGTRISYRT